MASRLDLPWLGILAREPIAQMGQELGGFPFQSDVDLEWEASARAAGYLLGAKPHLSPVQGYAVAAPDFWSRSSRTCLLGDSWAVFPSYHRRAGIGVWP